jgi:hypothetical protein
VHGVGAPELLLLGLANAGARSFAPREAIGRRSAYSAAQFCPSVELPIKHVHLETADKQQSREQPCLLQSDDALMRAAGTGLPAPLLGGSLLDWLASPEVNHLASGFRLGGSDLPLDSACRLPTRAARDFVGGSEPHAHERVLLQPGITHAAPIRASAQIISMKARDARWPRGCACSRVV